MGQARSMVPPYELPPRLGASVYSADDPRRPFATRLDRLLLETETLLVEGEPEPKVIRRAMTHIQKLQDALLQADLELGPIPVPPSEFLVRGWDLVRMAEERWSELAREGREMSESGCFYSRKWVDYVTKLSGLEVAAGLRISRRAQLERSVDALSEHADFLRRVLAANCPGAPRAELEAEIGRLERRILFLGSLASPEVPHPSH